MGWHLVITIALLIMLQFIFDVLPIGCQQPSYTPTYWSHKSKIEALPQCLKIMLLYLICFKYSKDILLCEDPNAKFYVTTDKISAVNLQTLFRTLQLNLCFVIKNHSLVKHWKGWIDASRYRMKKLKTDYDFQTSVNPKTIQKHWEIYINKL